MISIGVFGLGYVGLPVSLEFSKKFNVMKLAYMYHHISGIYVLLCDSRELPIREIMFWGELSNLPSYPLYHLLHVPNPNQQLTDSFRILQKIVYTSIRIPILTRGMIKYLITRTTNKHLFAICPVYLMGLIWSIKIISKSLNNH